MATKVILMNRENASLREVLIHFGLPLLAAIIAVRGAASLIPNTVLYDMYGDVRAPIVLLGGLLGLFAFYAVGKALNDFGSPNDP